MIRFGTAGWRGIIGEEFTFQKVRLVTQGIANYLWQAGLAERGIILGYDTRFLSERFALESAKVLASNKINVLLCERDTPTPVLSYEVIRSNLGGAINFTASHNPPEYNGLKYSDEDGSPAMPQVTKAIENEIDKLTQSCEVVFYYADKSYIETFREQQHYLDYLGMKVSLDKNDCSSIKVAVDPLFGTARDYIDKFIFDNGCIVYTIHNFRDPYFGGYSPEVSEDNLDDLKKLVIDKECDLGIAMDADADRFAIINDRGEYASCNLISALILDYLISTQRVTKCIGRSVSTTHLLDKIAQYHNMNIVETPVGFKYLAQLLKRKEIEFAAEESGGFSIKEHIPEKDGILASLLVIEIISKCKDKLSNLIRKLQEKYGYFYYKRIDIPATLKVKKKLMRIIKNPPNKINNKKVINVNTHDGLKLYLESNEWLLIRLSGTEPLLRIYTETCDISSIDNLIKGGKELF